METDETGATGHQKRSIADVGGHRLKTPARL
jgi:hypothetical protein